MTTLSVRSTLIFNLALTLGLSAFSYAAPQSHVFVESNAASGNSILVFNRNADGTLTLNQTVPTGQLGTGAGLGSQGALATTSHFLLAVNAGSNSITVLTIGNVKVSVVSTLSSGGTQPVSLTIFEKTVYVLNAGNKTAGANISGFTFDEVNGVLNPIAGSAQPLSSGAFVGPAQVGFNKQGNALIVTETLTNIIDVYPVINGVAAPPTLNSSNGPEPFGFAAGIHNRFYISEVFPGVNNGSAVSSYSLNANNTLSVISGSVTDNQNAACWVLLNAANTLAYVVNFGSNSVSVMSIDANGNLALIPGDTINTGGTNPVDEGLSMDGANLYVLNITSGTIGEYTVNADGSLTKLALASGVPKGSGAGMVVK